jgi:hypothetical protein
LSEPPNVDRNERRDRFIEAACAVALAVLTILLIKL